MTMTGKPRPAKKVYAVNPAQIPPTIPAICARRAEAARCAITNQISAGVIITACEISRSPNRPKTVGHQSAAVSPAASTPARRLPDNTRTYKYISATNNVLHITEGKRFAITLSPRRKERRQEKLIEGLVTFVLRVEQREVSAEYVQRDVALVHLVAMIGEIQQTVLAQKKRGKQDNDEPNRRG